MKVLKFGGTSVGTVESLRNVKSIVDSIPGKAVVVVSALGGLTDKLISMAHAAAKDDKSWKEEMQHTRNRHFHIVKEMVPQHLKAPVSVKLSELLDELERIYEGVNLLKSLSDSVLDIIVSYGERMSSVIVAAMVENGKRYYSPDFVKTEKWYGKNVADSQLTEKLIRETFASMAPNEKAIVPGFISSDSTTGEITNLGRGGSDFTGALIAAALDAEVLEIWTDVDGFMTADPRVVKDAIIIDHLTFTESMELCTFGAKVIYPPTIFPVFHKNIPIKILNTFNPGAPGTLIDDRALNEDLEIKGVTALKGIFLISIEINSGKNDNDYARRALKILSNQAVSIIPVANTDPASELKFALSASDPKTIMSLLTNEFFPEISDGLVDFPRLKEDLCAVAIVGKDMKGKKRLGARLGHSMLRNSINVESYSPGNSDTTLIYIINQDKISVALPLLHSIIFS